VLLGVNVAGGRPWITEAAVVPSELATSTFYELPRDTRPRVVDEARLSDPRVGYLGEWHSHPADVGPSATDAATMRRLAADPDAGCPHPLLIIVRRTSDGAYWLDAREFSRRRLRQLDLIIAGDLPAPKQQEILNP
jgi:hypothetical protein